MRVKALSLTIFSSPLQPGAIGTTNVKELPSAKDGELNVLSLFLPHSPVPCWTWIHCPPRVPQDHQLPPRLGEVSLIHFLAIAAY